MVTPVFTCLSEYTYMTIYIRCIPSLAAPRSDVSMVLSVVTEKSITSRINQLVEHTLLMVTLSDRPENRVFSREL